MTVASKTIEIVAGPNGSGKTTFAKAYLHGKQGRSVYLNPDLIASGIAPLDFEKASFQAGRVLIEEIKRRIERGESFAFESTLSGKTWLHVLKGAIDQGYQVTIYFLYLDSVKKNLQRIRKRVSLGGHPIPPEAVHRRHPRCFSNFWHLYRPLCSDWYVFDNSGKKPKSLQSKAEFGRLPESKQSKFQQVFLAGEVP
jgi:predicted ABC-type ATPase